MSPIFAEMFSCAMSVYRGRKGISGTYMGACIKAFSAVSGVQQERFVALYLTKLVSKPLYLKMHCSPYSA